MGAHDPFARHSLLETKRQKRFGLGTIQDEKLLNKRYTKPPRAFCSTGGFFGEILGKGGGGKCFFGTNFLLTHVFLHKGDNQLLNSAINQLLFGY